MPEPIGADRELDRHERFVLRVIEPQLRLADLDLPLLAARLVDRLRFRFEHLVEHFRPDYARQEIVNRDPLVVPSHPSLRLLQQVRTGQRRLGRHLLEHLVVEAQHHRLELRHDQVLVVARIADEGTALRIAGQIGSRDCRVLRNRLAREEEQPGLPRAAGRTLLIVEIRLVRGSTAVHGIEIESRRTEVGERVRIVLSIEHRHGIERQVVIDELPEVCVAGRDWLGRLFFIDLPFGRDLLLCL